MEIIDKRVLHGISLCFLCGVGIESVDIADLDTSKYLKSIGYNKPSYWYWLDIEFRFVKKGLKRVKMNKRRMNHNRYTESYSAPTREETIRWIKSYNTSSVLK